MSMLNTEDNVLFFGNIHVMCKITHNSEVVGYFKNCKVGRYYYNYVHYLGVAQFSVACVAATA